MQSNSSNSPFNATNPYKEQLIKYSLPNSPMVSRAHSNSVIDPVSSNDNNGLTRSSFLVVSKTSSPTNWSNISAESERSVAPSTAVVPIQQGLQSVSLSDLSGNIPENFNNNSSSSSSNGATIYVSQTNDLEISRHPKRRSIQQDIILSSSTEYNANNSGVSFGQSSPSLFVNAESPDQFKRRPNAIFSSSATRTSIPESKINKAILEEPQVESFRNEYSFYAKGTQSTTHTEFLTGNDKDEFFRVVGVQPTIHGSTSRVVVYVSPAHNIKPVGEDSVLMVSTSTKSSRSKTKQKNQEKSELRENVVKLDTSRIAVRFSTNDLNEKLVKGEWKGRARIDELYSAKPVRELMKQQGNVSYDKSGFVPFNTLCKAQKLQSLYLVSDLREAGLFNGAQISSISFKISDSPDRPLENFRIAYKWTYDDSLMEFSEGLEVCHGPVHLRHSSFNSNDWISFPLNKTIEWDGKSNLLIEISKDETHSSFSWPATGGIFFRNTAAVRTIAQKDNNDSSGQYPFSNWQRPNRFRKVPCLSIAVKSPPCFKIVCVAPLLNFNNQLVNVEVAVDGHKFTKESASFVYREVDPVALNKLIADLSKLLDSSNSLSDVLFEVGSGVGRQTEFKAHSVILAGRSPVFKALFFGKQDQSKKSLKNHRAHSKSFVSKRSLDDWSIDKLKRTGSEFSDIGKLKPSSSDDNIHRLPEKETYIVKVPDLRPGVFHTLLRYLYTGTVEIELESACELLATATRYEVLELIQSTEEFLKQSVHIENVTALLLSAEKWKVNTIRSFCLDFILWHFDSVSKTEGFARDLVPKHDIMREILLSRKGFVARKPNDLGGSNFSKDVHYPDRVLVSFPSKLLSDLSQLLNTQQQKGDVIFCVGEEQETFKCHKVIMSSRCEVFNAMLTRSQMKESKGTVTIPSISSSVFYCLLQYLYTSTCDITNDNIFQLYSAADLYCLDDLKWGCEEFIMQELTVDNVAKILVGSEKWCVGSVKNVCMELAVREFDEVSVSEGFLNEVVVRHDLMLEILQGRSSEQ